MASDERSLKMRRLRTWFLAVATLGWMATSALAQGLYGAPEMLPLSPATGSPEVYRQNLPYGAYNQTPDAYSGTQSYPQTPYQTQQPSQLAPPSLTPLPPQTAQYPYYAPLQPLPRSTAGYPTGPYPSGQGGYRPQRPVQGPYVGPAERPSGYRIAAAGANGSGSLTSNRPGPAPNQYAPYASEGSFDAPAGGPNGGSSSTGSPFLDALCGYECDPFYRPTWYARAYGLLFTRDRADGVATTVNPATGDWLMQTSDADVDWRGGYDVKIGAFFGQSKNWGVEGGYWTIDRFRGFSQASLAGGVDTALAVDQIEFGGVNGDSFFNNAAGHRIARVNRLESAEVSLVRRCDVFDVCGFAPMDLTLLAGVRYVVFREELTFGGLTAGGTWGGNPTDEAYFNDRVINNLIGFQFGIDTGFRLARTLRIFATPKFGIYNNHIDARFDAYRGDFVRGNPTPGSGITGTYPVSVDRDVFAVLSQIDVGVDWEFAPHWSAIAGYRLLAATNLGLADHQFPNNVVDFASLATVKADGSLLIHGAFAGLQFEF